MSGLDPSGTSLRISRTPAVRTFKTFTRISPAGAPGPSPRASHYTLMPQCNFFKSAIHTSRSIQAPGRSRHAFCRPCGTLAASLRPRAFGRGRDFAT